MAASGRAVRAGRFDGPIMDEPRRNRQTRAKPAAPNGPRTISGWIRSHYSHVNSQNAERRINGELHAGAIRVPADPPNTPASGLECQAQCPEDSFSPINPITISAALATRATLNASPIITIPKMNAPTAPMPVHTA
ncbi:protein of unknown function [Paraburkholderia dioscoreae]|uniref:Uncharacterized protein n=1 Tax=Paraburkholderia dioscoreae TaxID=2604047 RepID=A0A5Q4Z636_9BURK|nr:protein of unknown function [Paraburkholderia dioscoreae]